MRLRARHQPGAGPAILFLHGLGSDMGGDKARALSAHARARGRELLRFDLSGHGGSDGRFEHCTISQWRDDALLALDRLERRPALLVGSSLGGWLALLAALLRPEAVAGLLLIAPAPDFTRRVEAGLPAAAREALDREGVWLRPSRYGAPTPITRRVLEDGERLCLLDGPIALSCPVCILHGQQDRDVPWQGSLLLAERLLAPEVETVLIKAGDHRLSRPDQLALMLSALDRLAAKAMV